MEVQGNTVSAWAKVPEPCGALASPPETLPGTRLLPAGGIAVSADADVILVKGIILLPARDCGCGSGVATCYARAEA